MGRPPDPSSVRQQVATTFRNGWERVCVFLPHEATPEQIASLRSNIQNAARLADVRITTHIADQRIYAFVKRRVGANPHP